VQSSKVVVKLSLKRES